jgi:hypothetical protein
MSHTTTEPDPQNIEAVKLRGMSPTSATCQQMKTYLSRVIRDSIFSGGFLHNMGKTALKKQNVHVRDGIFVDEYNYFLIFGYKTA